MNDLAEFLLARIAEDEAAAQDALERGFGGWEWLADQGIEVVVTREGSDWLADVPAVPGAHTFARSLAGLKDSAREAIILADDLADDAQVDIVFRFEIDDDLVKQAVKVGTERRELADRERQVQRSTEDAIGALKTAGYSVRDAAALLGVSPGRISQIAEGPRHRKPGKRAVTPAAPRKAAAKAHAARS